MTEVTDVLPDGIWDILAFQARATDIPPSDAVSRYEALRSVAQHFFIGNHNIARKVVGATRANGLNVHIPAPVGKFQMVAIPVDWSPGEQMRMHAFDEWDSSIPHRHIETIPDGPVSRVLRILRLVQPCTIGYEHAARVKVEQNDAVSILPYDGMDAGRFAYGCGARTSHLTTADLTEFEGLWSAYNLETFPSRVEQAIIFHERACWDSHGMIRVPLVATALESLVHSRSSTITVGTTAQFTVHLNKLMQKQALSTIAFLAEDFASFYDLRSEILHGRANVLKEDKPFAERIWFTAEDCLRAILRNAVLNASFARLFQSDESIASELMATEADWKEIKSAAAERQSERPAWANTLNQKPKNEKKRLR